ncbi:MAG TPA: carboxypeptidase-like regulatory domain-containing protein [Candidatus Saccharimonadales bacterium]|nr:carboxypeptidase-like regulatory domain-containing protein [Candidatus Saccharimonadales bacterium]
MAINHRLSLLLAFFLVALLGTAEAQTQVTELPEVQTSRTLSAVVQDPAGAAVPGAIVEEFSPDWKVSWRTGRTGPDGRFVLAAIGPRKIYYLQITAPGFKKLHLKMQLNPKLESTLKLKLEKAT